MAFAVSNSDFAPNTDILAPEVNANFIDLQTATNERFGTWQTLSSAATFLGKDAAAVSRNVSAGVGLGILVPVVTASTFLYSSDSSAPSVISHAPNVVAAPTMFYVSTADATATSMTQQMRVSGQVSTNATQPTITLTFFLVQVTSFTGGGSGESLAFSGSSVTGSSAAVASPSSSATTNARSAVFTLTTSGFYALFCSLSATLTDGNASLLTAQLQTRSV